MVNAEIARLERMFHELVTFPYDNFNAEINQAWLT